MKYKKLNKSAVSLLISYVLLISIVLALSVGVFSWLKIMANVTPIIDCKEDTSLVIIDYKCTPDLGDPNTANLKLTLKNNGRFNIDGVIVTVAGETDTSTINYLAPESDGGKMNGHYYFSSPLKPSEETTISFINHKYNGNTLELIGFNDVNEIELQPFIVQEENKFERVICKNAIKKIPVQDCTIVGEPTTNPPNEITIPEPVAYWKLDDLTDEKGLNDWELRGDTNFLEQGISGFGNCAEFDGSGDHLKITALRGPNADKLAIKNQQITISALIKKTSSTLNKEGIIKRGLSGDNPINQEYALYIENNKAYFSIGDKTYSKIIEGGNIIQNQWYHLVGIVTPDSVQIYTDGVKSSNTKSPVGTIDEFVLQNLGSLNNNGDSFTGLIDEVKIWNTALTSEQITKLCQDYSLC